MEVRKKVVETEFGRISFLEAGSGSKTIVFLHGMWGWIFGRIAIFPWLAERYAPRGYKILVPSLPGHWGSFLIPQGYTFPQMVATMKSFLEIVGADKKTIVIGHSLGGSTGLVVGSQLGIKKIIAIDPMVYFFKDAPAHRIAGWIIDRCKDWFGKPGPKIGSVTDVIVYVLFWKRYWDLLKTIDVRSFLKRGTVLFWGREDHLCPLDKFKEEMQYCRIITFSGGHWWYNFQKERLLDELDKFIQ